MERPAHQIIHDACLAEVTQDVGEVFLDTLYGEVNLLLFRALWRCQKP